MSEQPSQRYLSPEERDHIILESESEGFTPLFTPEEYQRFRDYWQREVVPEMEELEWKLIRAHHNFMLKYGSL